MIQSRLFIADSGKNLFQKLLGLFFFIGFLALLFYLFFQLYKVLYFLSPLLLLIAVILYPKAIYHHIKNIQRSFEQGVVSGLLTLLLQIIALPFVSIGLVFKAWALRKFGTLQEDLRNNANGEEYTSYEDLGEIPDKAKDTAPSNPMKKETEKLLSTYDDLFE